MTPPDLFRAHLTEQIRLPIENHSAQVEIGESSEPIPVHFAYRRDIDIEAGISDGGKSMPDQPLRDFFHTPDLAAWMTPSATVRRSRALFRAARERVEREAEAIRC